MNHIIHVQWGKDTFMHHTYITKLLVLSLKNKFKKKSFKLYTFLTKKSVILFQSQGYKLLGQWKLA